MEIHLVWRPCSVYRVISGAFWNSGLYAEIWVPDVDEQDKRRLSLDQDLWGYEVIRTKKDLSVDDDKIKKCDAACLEHTSRDKS